MKGTEHDGWNRMKKSDDGGFHRRAGNRIHEPEEGKVRDAVADLGHQLAEPYQTEISRKEQAAADHDGDLFLCGVVRRSEISL